MEFTKTVKDPLPGERLVGLQPEPSPHVGGNDWARERFFTGRTVTEGALQGEQVHREGRVRLLGQQIRAGTLSGLDVTWQTASGSGAARLTIAPGHGICADGEDVVVPRAFTVRLEDLLAFELLGEAGDGDLGSHLRARQEAREALTRPRTRSLPTLPTSRPSAAAVIENFRLQGELLRELGFGESRDLPGALIERLAKATRIEPRQLTQVRAEKLVDDVEMETYGRSNLKQLTQRLAAALDLKAADRAPVTAAYQARVDGELLGRLLDELAIDPEKWAEIDGPSLFQAVSRQRTRMDLEKLVKRVVTLTGDRTAAATVRAVLDAVRARILIDAAKTEGGLVSDLARVDPEKMAKRLMLEESLPSTTRARASFFEALTTRAALAQILVLRETAVDEVEPPPAYPYAAALVLVPCTIDEDAVEPDDPCDRDVDAEAFLDWRTIDAARLAWVPFDTLLDERATGQTREGWRADQLGDATSGDLHRNRLCWGLFDLEAQDPNTPMPWNRDAVPLALFAFQGEHQVEWVDAAAVVRQAGRRQPLGPLVPSASEEALLQARIQQFNRQLGESELDASRPLAERFRYLPPVGILPRELFDFQTRKSPTFPSGFAISAAPIPREQLELVSRTAARLGPIDLEAEGDELKLLIPVPPEAWDPGLLQIATVDSVFWSSLSEAEQRRDLYLQRRAELRSKLAILWTSLAGPGGVPAFPADEENDDSVAVAVELAVLWANPLALRELGELAREEPTSATPVLQPASQATGSTNIQTVAAALLASIDGTGSLQRDEALGTLVDSAFEASETEGPVAVYHLESGSSPRVLQGPGLRLPGRWTHRFMTDDLGHNQAHATKCSVYLVRGEIDTEVLDRAIDWWWPSPSGGQPRSPRPTTSLVVVGTGISDLGREELGWKHQQGHADTPTVCVLSGPLSIREEALDDLVLRAKTTVPDPNYPRELVTLDVEAFLATPRSITLVGLQTTTSSDLEETLAALEASEAAATLSSAQRRRLGRLRGKAAAIGVPTDDRASPQRVSRAVEVITALLSLDTALGYTGMEILRRAGAREGSFGTIPNDTGLAVELVIDLLDALANKVSPLQGTPGTVLRVLDHPTGNTDDPDATSELDVVVELGITGLSTLLEEKASRADDVIDFGFLQVQAAIFKIREHLVGRDKALAMSKSPILGDLADLIDADTSPERLARFFEALQEAATTEPNPPDDPTARPGWLAGAIGYQVSKDVVATHLDTGWKYGNAYEDLLGTIYVQDAVVWDPPLVDLGIAAASGISEAAGAAAVLTAELDYSTGTLSEVWTPALDESAFIAFDVMHRARLDAQPTAELALGARLAGSPRARGTTAPIRATTPTGTAPPSSTQPRAAATASTPAPEAATSLRLPSIQQAVRSGGPVVGSVGITRMINAANFLKKSRPVSWSIRETGIAARTTEEDKSKIMATELRATAFRIRASVTQAVHHLDLNLEGVHFPGFLKEATTESTDGAGDTVDVHDGWLVESRALTDELVEEVLLGKHDLHTLDDDVSGLFTDAIKSLEATAAMLRIVESRVREVREMVQAIARTQILVERLIDAAHTRHDALEAGLEEARHDVATTRSLLAEEQERLETLNRRRTQILQDQVPFVLFHRARVIDLTDDAPVHDLEPQLSGSPAIVALGEPAPAAPAALQEMVQLWREAPVRWFPPLRSLLSRIDRPRSSHAVLVESAERARLRAGLLQASPLPRIQGLRGLQLIEAVVQIRQARLLQIRIENAVAQVSSPTSWKAIQLRARQLLCVDDLIASRNVRTSLSHRASQELEDVYRVAANLYREFGRIAPELRVLWVRRVSEHDDFDLRDLATLPRWRDVGLAGDGLAADPFRKRELQALVDWIFSRVDADDSGAIALANDLVRVALLLASHAPVGQILVGHVDRPMPLEPGALVPVQIDTTRLRIGMEAIFLRGGEVRGRGILADIAGGRAVARVSSSQASLTLETNDVVRFLEIDGAASPDVAAPTTVMVTPPMLSVLRR